MSPDAGGLPAKDKTSISHQKQQCASNNAKDSTGGIISGLLHDPKYYFEL
jgi:hypothetical protein